MQTFTRTWEIVNAYCQRLQVPGGWLVKTWAENGAQALCFFPDAKNEWVLV